MLSAGAFAVSGPALAKEADVPSEVCTRTDTRIFCLLASQCDYVLHMLKASGRNHVTQKQGDSPGRSEERDATGLLACISAG